MCRRGTAGRHIICENARQQGILSGEKELKGVENERKGVKRSDKKWVKVRDKVTGLTLTLTQLLFARFPILV